jgi:hypothetical protein
MISSTSSTEQDDNCSNFFSIFNSPKREASTINDCELLEMPLLTEQLHYNNNAIANQHNDDSSFLSYFMHIDYNTNFLNHSQSNTSLCDSTKTSSQDNLARKTQRNDVVIVAHNDNNDDILIDELTGNVYNRNEDINAYRKAKKRIQNRESALRMKTLKKENLLQKEDMIKSLQYENEKLIKENTILKKEKNFLIDQIKTMQQIINKSSLIKTQKKDDIKISNDNDDVYLNYNGIGQNLKTRIFNVFLICFLCLIYIVGEYTIMEDPQTKGAMFNKGQTITLNSFNDKSKSTISAWQILSKVTLITICILILPWIKDIIRLIKNKTYE